MHKKRVSGSRVKLTEIVFPEDTNPYGSLFGGRLVSLMDKAAFLCATRNALRKEFVSIGSNKTCLVVTRNS